jgi:hypothetical protein
MRIPIGAFHDRDQGLDIAAQFILGNLRVEPRLAQPDEVDSDRPTLQKPWDAASSARLA